MGTHVWLHHFVQFSCRVGKQSLQEHNSKREQHKRKRRNTDALQTLREDSAARSVWSRPYSGAFFFLLVLLFSSSFLSPIPLSFCSRLRPELFSCSGLISNFGLRSFGFTSCPWQKETTGADTNKDQSERGQGVMDGFGNRCYSVDRDIIEGSTVVVS